MTDAIRTPPAPDVVERKVIVIVADKAQTAPGEVSRGRRFYGDLPVDSLDIAEIIMDIEETFDLDVPDEDATAIQTVGDAIDYVIAHSR